MADGAAVLITGAGGFTGRHASRRFAARGYKVFALVRSKAGLPAIEGGEYVFCDLTDQAGIRRLIDRIRPQFVLHLGGKNSVPDSWSNPLLYIESNVMTTLYLLDALQRCGLRDTRILVAGSRLKFGLKRPLLPTHPYGLSKSLQEAAALSWGKLFDLGVMIAEPGNLVGSGPSTGICSLLARHIVRLERGESPSPFRLSSADARRDFLDVRDAVDAYEMLLRQGEVGEVYPVCSGQERSLAELVRDFSHLTATKDLNIQIGASSGAEVLPQTDPPLPQALWSMGWQAGMAWEQTLQDVLDYFRKEGAASS
ncbi:NAD-dependent epimerase/dehydratase family protein [Paenibacillus rubinfantis]|uniref:NAD-dependent epimerase/dehydratase family protein n=1 Tax=Paenibacillus rubinfantis TaxID=1720296 RepID=UPI00073E22D6|nr:NAD-dependent epimerase/dehydratase family protein [Paenibacillus rubinfantis]